MRPEIRQYNYDWLMGRTLKAAAALGRGTEKEASAAFEYMPYFRGVASSFLREGEPGKIFLELLAQYYDNILTAHRRGKKLVATTFCKSPVIFFAADMVPVTFEILTAIGGLVWKRGMFEYMDFCCEAGMTETSCSSQRGAMGAYLAGLGERIDLVVCDTPGVCDTNATAFAFTAAYLGIPFFQLNYPSSIGDERSQRYHMADYLELVRFLEENSGKPMDFDRLAGLLSEVERQDYLTAELEDLMALVPSPVPPIYSLMLYAGRFCFAGDAIFTRLLSSMLESAQENAGKGKAGIPQERLRMFTCYIDHYTVDLNFWRYLEDRGIAHIGSILSRNFRDNNAYCADLPGSCYSIDTSDKEAMLESIAQMNARLPMVRSIRGPYDQPGMWLAETLALAKRYRADCIVYNGTPGCRNTWGMVKPFARELEKHGFPVHIMYDDAFDDRVESWEATRERLDEFFQVRGLL